MKTFFNKLWWVFKPINKWHIVVYLVLICISIQHYVTRPPSRVITDFEQVEGILTKLTTHATKADLGSSVVINQMGSNKIIGLRTRGNDSYRTWINKPVVAYYWPARGFSDSDLLVLMAPLAEKQAYIDDFNRHKGGFGNVKFLNSKDTFTTWVYFFLVWVGPIIWRKSQADLAEKRKNEKN